MRVTIDTKEKTITFHDDVNMDELAEFLDGIDMDEYLMRHEKSHQSPINQWKFPSEPQIMPYKFNEYVPQKTTSPSYPNWKPYCLTTSGKVLIKG